MKKTFGLIGYPLSHSFSKKYFTEKFQKQGLSDYTYENFELKQIDDLPALIRSYPELCGLNVTIPYKEQVIAFLDDLDPYARKIGAVNVIRIENGKLTGFNSDYFGFRKSLEDWVGPALKQMKALVLGTGGAAKAILAVLEDCNVEYRTVSRTPGRADLTYADLGQEFDWTKSFPLIINTTPLGMYPQTNEAPFLPYQKMNDRNYLYDLIYNPEKTLFLQQGEQHHAKIKNGLDMLIKQAEKSWEIWN